MAIAIIAGFAIGYNWNRIIGTSGPSAQRAECRCPNGTVHQSVATGNCAKACAGLI